MSEQLKFITAELKKEPFGRTYNLISFDSLSGEQLLQILSDVLAVVEAKPHGVDIREEDPEATVLRILGLLRILKYKPPMEISDHFRQGLVEGHKQVVYPVLEWLLHRIPELKTRAYLARFLVKVEVPPEVAVDPEVADLYQQYEDLIGQFKECHRELEGVRNSGYSTVELRRDIEEMEREKDIVDKKVERMQRKVEGAPNFDPMMSAVKELRQEKERQKELQAQKGEQRTAIGHGEQRLSRLERQLKDLRAASVGATPEGLLQRMEEETRVNSYIVTQKLPKEIETYNRAVENLQRVVGQPALGQEDLGDLRDRIKAVQSEIEEATNRRNVTNDPLEDKLTLFRQQAAIISRKKEATAETLSDTRSELGNLEDDIRQKREYVASLLGVPATGGGSLKGDDFRKYVSSLKGKSSEYKVKKAELSDLRAEYGVLARTVEILQAQESGLRRHLNEMEAERGVAGFGIARANLDRVDVDAAGIDEAKGRTLDDMAGMVQRLTAKIGERKTRLAPIIKELRPLRQAAQEMQVDYEARKREYDKLQLQLESSMSRLESEVKQYQEEILANEQKQELLQLRRKLQLEVFEARATNEVKLYVGSQREAVPKMGVREQLLKGIAEAERRSKTLKDEQKQVKDSLAASSTQAQIWANLEKLLECKLKCMEEANKDDDLVCREPGTETMVL